MDKTIVTMAQQIGDAVTVFQKQITGHAPTAVTVVLSDDTLVVTLHDALSPAEKMLADKPAGAAQVQEFHRQLFSNSSATLRQEIKRITGRDVREAAAEVETTTGSVVHAFTTGTMVQVFLLMKNSSKDAGSDNGAIPKSHNGISEMLVLSRKIDQSLAIEASLSQDHPCLESVSEAFDSMLVVDSSVPVHRWEVWERRIRGARPMGPRRIGIVNCGQCLEARASQETGPRARVGGLLRRSR